MSASRWLLSLSVCLCTATASAACAEEALGQQTASALVPRGTAVTLDGSLKLGEWEDAACVPMSDTVTLSFKYADGSLWLGVRAPEMGVVNVLVVDKGDVKVLHSSAALGTARYSPEGDAWRLMQDFVWRCRGISMSHAAIAERKVFFESEGWLASTAYMGNPGDLEVQMAWDGQPLQLAVLWLPASNPRNVTPWPTAVPRDALPAPIPAIAHFTPSQWATVVLQPAPLASACPRSGAETQELAAINAQQAGEHLRQCAHRLLPVVVQMPRSTHKDGQSPRQAPEGLAWLAA